MEGLCILRSVYDDREFYSVYALGGRTAYIGDKGRALFRFREGGVETNLDERPPIKIIVPLEML